MRKRILAAALTVLLCAALLPVCSASESPFRFTDVSPEAWYYSDVKTAADSGLVNGKTESEFCPDDWLTWAEAVKLAACMNQKYETGAVSLSNGDPWYKSYADYARMKGILTGDYDWSASADRAGYMAIFARALPDSALAAKNRIADGSIPDVPMTHPQAAQIYKLYRAGVVQGDEEHLCHPEDPIKRSEVAAILTRMMFSAERKSLTLGTDEPTPDSALRIVKNPVSVALMTEDEGASFTVEIAGGQAPYIYKWVTEKETGSSPTSASQTSGQRTSTYSVTFPPDTFEVSKTVFVYCVVTDSDGKSVRSEKAGVTPYSDALRVLKQPEDRSVRMPGDSAVSFSAEIIGGKPPYVFDWREELSSRTVSIQQISSETRNTLNVNDAEQLLSQGEEITVCCIVTDSAGAKTVTDRAKLKKDFLRAAVDPSDVILEDLSESFTLTAEAAGGIAPYSFQWYWGLAPDRLEDMSGWAEGYDTPVLTARPDPRYAAQYLCCRVRDTAGNEVFTSVASVRVAGAGTAQRQEQEQAEPLRILVQPADQTAAEGGQALFTVEAAGGSGSYSYEWQWMDDSTEWKRVYMTESSSSVMFTVSEIMLDEDMHFRVRCIVTDTGTGESLASDSAGIAR